MNRPDPSPAAMAAPSWSRDFRDPPTGDRPQVLWSWNGDITEERIDAQVAQFAAQGCGGVFVHPRPGLVTEYLSPRWFALWSHAADRCSRLGLECHLYDENSYPSGFGGGHVVAGDPSTAARIVRASLLASPAAPDGEVLACIDPVRGDRLGPEALCGASADTPVLALLLVGSPPKPKYAGFPLPDLCLPETAAAFLACTHDAYARAVGDRFGSTARMVFTDEPTLVRAPDAIPWSSCLTRAFAEDRGYRIEDSIGLLFVDGIGHEAVRHDYFTTLNRLVCGSFFRTVSRWCEEHRLAFTGHVDEHLWPSPFFLPSAAAALRWMQVPGNDLLAFAFSTADPWHARNQMARLNLRELDSVARQCARERTLVECSGGGGYAYGPAQMKRLEDFSLAFGTTVLAPHLAHISLAGSRRYDWGQSLSDHSPWWMDYRPHADHVARVATALRRGRVERRVLVLMPTTTAWLHARPGTSGDGPLERIRDGMLALLRALEEAGIDYDLGDETVLAELASVGDGVVEAGSCRYRTLVVPAVMSNWESSTCALVASAIGRGIPVHAEGGPPVYVDGRPDLRPRELAHLPGWRRHGGAAALAAALRAEFPPQLAAADGGPLPPELVWRRVETADGSLVFLCNPWDRPLAARLRLPGRGLLRLDTADGSVAPEASATAGDGQEADLDLPPGGHRLWLCTAAPVAVAVAATGPAWLPLATEPAGIEADHPNLLAMDFAQLQVGGREVLASTTVRVDTALWRAMGFPGCIWQLSSQYRRAFLDHDVSCLPGFRVRYQATLDPALRRDGLRLAVERPDLYRVLVNGTAVDGWSAWFDPGIGATPAGNLLRPGVNDIELVADRFDMRHEIAPVHLLGDFALEPAARGFRAIPPLPLGLGSWRALGRPLAFGTMTYAWRFHLERAAGRLRVRLPAWAGAAWRLAIDGEPATRSVHGQDISIVELALAPGPHRCAITIVSHPAHLGPHHGDGLPGRWSWERAWEPDPAAPHPGAQWLIPPAGLLAPPELACA
jgi:hypothetical protein